MNLDSNFWDIARSASSVLGLIISVFAIYFARSDRNSQQQLAGLNRVEANLDQKIVSDREISDERHSSNDRRLGSIEQRLAAIDEAIKHSPNQGNLNSLQLQIGEVSSGVSKLEGAVEASTRMVERMNTYLMERGT